MKSFFRKGDGFEKVLFFFRMEEFWNDLLSGGESVLRSFRVETVLRSFLMKRGLFSGLSSFEDRRRVLKERLEDGRRVLRSSSFENGRVLK